MHHCCQVVPPCFAACRHDYFLKIATEGCTMSFLLLLCNFARQLLSRHRPLVSQIVGKPQVPPRNGCMFDAGVVLPLLQQSYLLWQILVNKLLLGKNLLRIEVGCPACCATSPCPLMQLVKRSTAVHQQIYPVTLAELYAWAPAGRNPSS